MNQTTDKTASLKSVSFYSFALLFLSQVEPCFSEKSLRQPVNEVRRLNSTAECQVSMS